MDLEKFLLDNRLVLDRVNERRKSSDLISDGKESNVNQNSSLLESRQVNQKQNDQQILSPSETTIYTCGVKPNNQISSDGTTLETSSDSDNMNVTEGLSQEINKVLNGVRYGTNSYPNNQVNCSISDDCVASTSSGIQRSHKTWQLNGLGPV